MLRVALRSWDASDVEVLGTDKKVRTQMLRVAGLELVIVCLLYTSDAADEL